MINQQLAASPVGTAAGRRIDLPCKTFENYTVVASALVAESSGRRARLKPGCPIGRAGSSPAERTHAPLAQLEEALDLGSRCWGFDSLAGHNGPLAQQSRATGS